MPNGEVLASWTWDFFLDLDGTINQRLIVVPGQFRATTAVSPTVGVQRLYSDLEFAVYTSPISETDFIAPQIWQLEANTTPTTLTFRALMDDDSGVVERAIVLYRTGTANSWTRAEMEYDSHTGWAEATVRPPDDQVFFFIQALDPAGNVSMALDHGNASLVGTCTLLADVDDNGTVDVFDIQLIANGWNQAPIDRNLDLNRGNQVDIQDIMMAAGQFGRACFSK